MRLNLRIDKNLMVNAADTSGKTASRKGKIGSQYSRSIIASLALHSVPMIEKGGRNILRFFEATSDLKAVDAGFDQSIGGRSGVQVAGRDGILIAGDGLSFDNDVIKKELCVQRLRFANPPPNDSDVRHCPE